MGTGQLFRHQHQWRYAIYRGCVKTAGNMKSESPGHRVKGVSPTLHVRFTERRALMTSSVLTILTLLSLVVVSLGRHSDFTRVILSFTWLVLPLFAYVPIRM